MHPFIFLPKAIRYNNFCGCRFICYLNLSGSAEWPEPLPFLKAPLCAERLHDAVLPPIAFAIRGVYKVEMSPPQCDTGTMQLLPPE